MNGVYEIEKYHSQHELERGAQGRLRSGVGLYGVEACGPEHNTEIDSDRRDSS